MGDWTIIERARRDILGEGITYVAREDALYWVDIIGQRVNRFGLADGQYREWGMPEMTGWLIERSAAGALSRG
jgi:sugar lactone lactonase YvrE